MNQIHAVCLTSHVSWTKRSLQRVYQQGECVALFGFGHWNRIMLLSRLFYVQGNQNFNRRNFQP